MRASNTERRSWFREWLLPALITATCIRVWLIPGGDVLPRAQAQIPDSGMQRKQILSAALRTNELLTQIADSLSSGTIQVRVVDADNTSKTGGRLSNRTVRSPRLK